MRAITGTDGIAVLSDPVADAWRPERWWPPVMLDAAWIAQNTDRFDAMHVHFGMESLPEGRLAGALDALDALGKPLIHTVHDLENPQLHDQAPHRRDLDLLIPRATRLITLTAAAAAAVRRHWGRDALVVPHPTLLAEAIPVRARQEPWRSVRVGVHLRDLRPSIDGLHAVRSLFAALDALQQGGVQAHGRVLLNEATRDAAQAQRVADALRARADCDLVVRPRPDDAALVIEIDELDIALLPYAHGTHSGWVELCFDRGVPVIGPARSPMAEQHPHDYAGFSDPDGVARAVLQAFERVTPSGSDERRRVVVERAVVRALERARVARAHLALYREVVVASHASARPLGLDAPVALPQPSDRAGARR